MFDRPVREIKGDLDLNGFLGLVSLPPLKVSGDLSLAGCRNLLALPEDLWVGGDLDLRGCRSLTALPPGLYVGGVLDLDGCHVLYHVPDSIDIKCAIVEHNYAMDVLGFQTIRRCSRERMDLSRDTSKMKTEDLGELVFTDDDSEFISEER